MVVMRSSRQRSHPIVASCVLPGLAFYRTDMGLMSGSPTVHAETQGSPPLLVLPGKPSTPYLHGLVIVGGRRSGCSKKMELLGELGHMRHQSLDRATSVVKSPLLGVHPPNTGAEKFLQR